MKLTEQRSATPAPVVPEISVAAPTDRPHLLRLLRAQLAEHDIRISPARLGAAVDAALRDSRLGMFLLARARKRAIGVAYLSFQWTLEHGGKCAWLEELYVAPPFRERGMGSLLLAKVSECAREHGCAAVDLEVESDHRRAERLYRRHGFRPHRRRRWVRVL